MELRPGLEVDGDVLETFARRHGMRRLAVFGSALRSDFGADSDIDLLVEFEPGTTPGLLMMAAMELELEEIFGRHVDLRTNGDLSRYFRDRVRSEARDLYAA